MTILYDHPDIASTSACRTGGSLKVADEAERELRTFCSPVR
jgi:hypothetical protein